MPIQDNKQVKSSELCDELFQALKQKIKKLQRKKKDYSCSFFQAEKKCFAFTRHRADAKRVEVHFLSVVDAPPQSLNLVIKPNIQSIGGPEIGFNYSFDIESTDEVKDAATLLYKTAFLLSQTAS